MVICRCNQTSPGFSLEYDHCPISITLALSYELFFHRFLSQSGFSFRYEPEISGKTPDFVLYDNQDQSVAIVEITSLLVEHPRSTFSPSAWYLKITSEINCKRHKYGNLGLPLIVALCIDEPFLNELRVFEALRGDRVIKFPGFDADHGRIIGPAQLGFKDNGSLTAYKDASGNSRVNTTVSAVVLCRRTYKDHRWAFAIWVYENRFAANPMTLDVFEGYPHAIIGLDNDTSEDRS